MKTPIATKKSIILLFAHVTLSICMLCSASCKCNGNAQDVAPDELIPSEIHPIPHRNVEVTISNDETWMILCTSSNEFYSYNLKTRLRKDIHKCTDTQFEMNYSYMCPACFVPKTSIAAIASPDRNCVIYWDCQNSKEIFRHDPPSANESTIRFVRISEDGKKIVWTTENKLCISNLYDKKIIKTFDIFYKICKLEFINDHNLYISYDAGSEAILDTDTLRFLVPGQTMPHGSNEIQVPVLGSPLVAQEKNMDSIVTYDPYLNVQKHRAYFPIWLRHFYYISPTYVVLVSSYQQGNFGQSAPVHLEIFDIASNKCIARGDDSKNSGPTSIVQCINSRLYVLNDKNNPQIEVYDIGKYIDH